MKKVCFLTIGIFCLVIFQAFAQIKWDSKEFMPLSEIKPGMSGKAYTVFSGTTVEEFGFTVVSIEYNWSPQWNVIWVKGSGANFEATGGAGGMSGSPAYIDGRLIGALSLVYWDQREHANLAGITPIESMVEVTGRGMQPNLSYRGGNLFDFGSDTAGQGLNMLPLEPDASATQNTFVGPPLVSPAGMEKSALLQTPVVMPPINAQMMGFLKPLLDKYRLTPVAGTGGSSPIQDAPIEPGQILGMEMARGDFTVFGYGTMTYIDGKQLLGFGHSMFGEGNTNLPISGGYVHYVLPRITRSTKMASPTRPIGTLVQDRQAAIAGLIGAHPSFMPVNITVQTTDGKTHPLQYEVMRHRDMSASFVMFGAFNLVSALEIAGGDNTVNVETRIALKNQPELTAREIVRKNIYSSSASPGFAVFRALSPLTSLIRNNYTKIDVDKVTVDVKLEDKRKTAVIEGLRIRKDRYRPGETVVVALTLRPYLEEPIIQTGRITIPKDAPEGLTTVLVSSAEAYEAFQRARAPLNFRPKNINQLIRILQRGENNSDIIMELFVSKRGMTIQGEEFSDLPLSAMSVMSSPTQLGEGGYTLATTLHVDKLATKYVISGSGFVRFTVDRNAP